MAVYPAQLTTEEKNLKRRYARLQEKRKSLRKKSDKTNDDDVEAGPSSSLPVRKPSKESLNPKDAKEAAKKLIMAGKLTLQKQSTRKTGFKRVGELPGQAPPPAKKANPGSNKDHSEGDGKKTPSKPKYAASDVKKLYNRFIPSSKPDDLERIPKKTAEISTETSHGQREIEPTSFTAKECTVYVRWETDRKKSTGLNEEALKVAFRRFGIIQTLLPRSSEESGLKTKESAFLTFETPHIANTVRKEMDGGMVRGVDVWVSHASDENGYVELTPEAANNPWAVIAADRDSSAYNRQQELKMKTKRSMKIYGPADF